MSQSQNLRLSDVRRAFRLLGDCRDLGHDRSAWMRHAAEGLRVEVEALVVIASNIATPAIDKLPSNEFWDVGWPTDRERAAWLDLLRTGRFQEYPTVRRSLLGFNGLSVRSRDQMISDRAWYRSLEYNEDRGPLGQDDTLIATSQLRGGPGLRVFSLNRAVGQRKFSTRERRFVRLFSREVQLLAGTVLSDHDQGPFASLPPRLFQVLKALVEGDSEKQIATRLGLSRHTIHDYVKALHQRFGVGSRGELLAYYFRRDQSPQA